MDGEGKTGEFDKNKKVKTECITRARNIGILSLGENGVMGDGFRMVAENGLPRVVVVRSEYYGRGEDGVPGMG